VTGVVEAFNSRQLHTETDGVFEELLTPAGLDRDAGQPLVRLRNDALDLEIHAGCSGPSFSRSGCRRSRDAPPTSGEIGRPGRSRAEQHIAELLRRREAQLIVAPIAGLWSAAELDASRGQWLARGASVGTIVNDGGWRFVGVLPQVGSHVLLDRIDRSEIRLRGQEGENIRVASASVMPFEQGCSPYAGARDGRRRRTPRSRPPIPTASSPPSPSSGSSPGSIPAMQPDAVLMHGPVGALRLTLPSRPLLSVQWERRARQFLQRRFRV
jgi:putative peptide zinc metalloprotease protein